MNWLLADVLERFKWFNEKPNRLLELIRSANGRRHALGRTRKTTEGAKCLSQST
jgi:hypothetical protein